MPTKHGDHRPWVVVRPGNVQRPSVVAEIDRAPLLKDAEMPARGLEVGVRREAEPLGICHCAKHNVPRKLEWRAYRRSREHREVRPNEAAQIAPA